MRIISKVLWENVGGNLSHPGWSGTVCDGKTECQERYPGGHTFESLWVSGRDTVSRCGHGEKRKTDNGHKGKKVWDTEEGADGSVTGMCDHGVEGEGQEVTLMRLAEGGSVVQWIVHRTSSEAGRD